MVIHKNNPVGIDIVVRKIQNSIEKKLSWIDKINVYPRCYPVIREGLRSIEHYSEDGDYLNLVTAEENKCFSLQTTDIEKENIKDYSAEIELFFTIDLVEIYGTNFREDSQAHRDVLKCLKGVKDVEVIRLTTRIERVFEGYSFQIKEDMQPYHCFKIVLSVLFDPNNDHFCD